MAGICSWLYFVVGLARYLIVLFASERFVTQRRELQYFSLNNDKPESIEEWLCGLADIRGQFCDIQLLGLAVSHARSIVDQS
jgi:hypothetical protein